MLTDVRQELEGMATISRSQNEVLPLRVLTDQQCGIRSIGAPTQTAVEEFLLLESW